MYMNIQNQQIKFYQNIPAKKQTVTSFRSHYNVETIKHYNLGMMQNGIIGKVRVLKANGENAFLNVLKQTMHQNEELYQLKDDAGKIIGEMNLKINKIINWEPYLYQQDPSHVFVTELRNFSNPNTPYYREGLDEYRHVGTRLLQIAQRRSDESLCNGNIELIAKNEKSVLEFYKKLGFIQPAHINRFSNPYHLHLSPYAKEPLSKYDGGL